MAHMTLDERIEDAFGDPYGRVSRNENVRHQSTDAEEITSEDPYSQEAVRAEIEAYYPDLALRRRERRDREQREREALQAEALAGGKYASVKMRKRKSKRVKSNKKTSKKNRRLKTRINSRVRRRLKTRRH